MKPDWTIVEYRGRDGLMNLEADWTRLVAAMPDAGFQHAHETHVGYFDHMQSGLEPFTCLALSDGERVRAICPVEPQRHTILGRKTIAWGLPCGMGDVPRDVICPADDDAEQALFPCVTAFLRRTRPRRRWFVLGRVLERSAVWRCLQRFDRRSYCADLDDAAHIIDCDRPYSELTSDLSRKFRANLRNARNRLGSLTGVRFEHAVETADVRAAFETFLAVEASGWKGDSGTKTALGLRHKDLPFYRYFIDALQVSGRCEVNALHADGKCIASTFCMRVGAEYAVLRIAYDESYGRAAPGQLLLEHIVQRCCADRGIERVSMVSGARWNLVWRPDVVGSYNVFMGIGAWPAKVLVSFVRARFRYWPRMKRLLLRSPFGARVVQRLRER